ncbi:MAG: hypothetical protein CMJ94_10775 [Planctomycetes bacterium]|nr:hypothetical protein [Planctomycetota bacterium]
MTSPLRAQPARPGWQLCPYEADRHAAQHREVIAAIFSCELEEADRWVGVAGAEKIRVLEQDGEYAATAVLMPMAQFHGGRSVRTRGVAGVGVRPEYRRDGVGSLLMAEILREVEAQGEALSILYASTTKFYRGLGYEIAGTHYAARLETSYLPPVRTELEIRALTEDDRPAMQEIVRANGRVMPGHMDRCDYLWPRLLRPRGKPAQAFGVFDDAGKLRGFLAFTLASSEALDDFQAMELRVFEAADAEGLRGLMALLRSHHSMVREISTTLPPQSPFWSWLPEQRARMKMREQFLIRLVRVGDALAQRGYPVGVSGELLLEVEDPVLPDNHGLWHLRVRDGRGSAVRVADPDQASEDRVRLDAGALAALYSGHQSAENLAILDRAQGSPEALARASGLFVGRAPTCPEMF